MSVQAKLLIGHGKQKNTFCRSQWRKKIKKLVDNSAQRNTKKSTKYAGMIYVHSPWDIIQRVIKQTPFRLAGMWEDNALGWKIGHYPPIYQQRKGVYLLSMYEFIFNNNYWPFLEDIWCHFTFCSLQIMEAMALHLESSYEKLYRWTQGKVYGKIICSLNWYAINIHYTFSSVWLGFE